MAENEMRYALKFSESEQETSTDLDLVLCVGSVIAFLVYYFGTLFILCGIKSQMSQIALGAIVLFNICLLSKSLMEILSYYD